MKSRSYRAQNMTRRNQTHAQCFCKRHKTYTEDNGKSTFPLPQTTGSLQRKLFPSCSASYSTALLPPRTLHLLLTACTWRKCPEPTQRCFPVSAAQKARSQKLEKPPRVVLGNSSFPSAQHFHLLHIVPPLAEATVEFFPANLALNHPSRPSDSRFIFLDLC